jgi:DNA processing protein
VSGLAYGIDAAAHSGALAASGPTIAVLASGLDRPSPVGNRRLARRILDTGGAWVSEYPPGTGAHARHFPERNRLISGLARITLIVEAREKSGTLWTARHAIDQNRSVFVVPGPVDSDAYRGSNALLRDGAGVALEPGDLFRDLGLEVLVPRATASHDLGARILAQLTEGPSTPDALAAAVSITASEVSAALLDLELDNLITRRGTRIALR